MKKQRMKPTFLGIGVPRCGTTWLHAMLARHPRVYVPTRRKEVDYFEKYYDRGHDWYGRFFPVADKSEMYAAVGEITPMYFFSHTVARRIAEFTSVDRLLLMLRNPVDRLYSEYCWDMRYSKYRGDFEAYISDRPDRVERGHYAKFLQYYLDFFHRDKILVLIMEEAITSRCETIRSLCTFLGVNYEQMPSDAGSSRVNAGNVPRFRRIFAVGSAGVQFCQRHDLDFLVTAAKGLGLKKLLLSNSIKVPHMSCDLRRQLTDHYASSVEELASILGRPLDQWLRSDSKADNTA